MHLKILLFFITLTGGLLPSEALYAVNSRGIIQDSIKQVTIKVIAAEKTRALDFDSLINSNQATKSLKNQNQITRPARLSEPAIKSSGPKTRNSVSNSSSSVPREIKEPVKTQSKTIGNQKPLPSKTAIEEHKDEIQEAPAQTDDTTVLNEAKTARTYLWIGFMLIVVGVILAILFGKTALLVSVAGTIFVIIGYSI